MVEGLLRNGRSAGHVLVGGVGAGADQADLQLLRPAVRLDGVLELAEGSSKIGGEGTVDVRLELREVLRDL